MLFELQLLPLLLFLQCEEPAGYNLNACNPRALPWDHSVKQRKKVFHGGEGFFGWCGMCHWDDAGQQFVAGLLSVLSLSGLLSVHPGAERYLL